MSLFLGAPITPGTIATNASTAKYPFVIRGLVGAWGASVDPSAHDLSGGSKNNGEITGGVTTVGARGGRTWQFNGATGYVRIKDSQTLSITNQITLSAWVRSAAAGGEGIISKSGLDFRNGDYFLAKNSAGGTVRFGINGGAGGQFVDSATNFDDGVWHFVVGVYDRANLRIYIDGVPEATTVGTAAITDSEVDVIVGGYYSTTYLWTGEIDNAGIYNRALNASEVKQLYDITRQDRREIFRARNLSIAYGGELGPGAIPALPAESASESTFAGMQNAVLGVEAESSSESQVAQLPTGVAATDAESSSEATLAAVRVLAVSAIAAESRSESTRAAVFIPGGLKVCLALDIDERVVITPSFGEAYTLQVQVGGCP